MLGLMAGLAFRNPGTVVMFALAGALIGHFFFDAAHEPRPDADLGDDEPDAERTPARKGRRQPLTREALETQAQQHFARHVCALLIEVARSDGEVVRDEMRVAREYFQHELKYGPEALEVVREHLKEFLHKPPSLDAATAACREEMPAADRLLLVDVLYQLALADGALQRAEQDTLRRIGRGLGLQEEDMRAVAARHLGSGDAHYTRLGLPADASDADVKRAFRQLATTHHPDKVAHLGPGAVEQATRRFREIKDAYEEIRRLRGL
ncbi:TerB family tellurite resistance protein [Myxococcaceae bacterium GXIMD 01537]